VPIFLETKFLKYKNYQIKNNSNSIQNIQEEEKKKDEKPLKLLQKEKEENKRRRSTSREKIKEEELDECYSDCEFDDDDFKEKKKEVKKSKKKIVKYNLAEKLGKKENLYEQEVDTNILSLKFDFLKNSVPYATGDPVYCNGCNSILNKHSNIKNVDLNMKSKYLWICEFCGVNNTIFLEEPEIPKEEILDYFIQSSNQLNKNLKDMNYNDQQNLIYCFDISGSMCVSEPVQGKHKFKGSRSDKEYQEFMKFSDGSDQSYGKKGVTYISRLQCLQAAIENNLIGINKAAPTRKVGFVVFNNEVVGIGDGSKGDVKINGNNLNDYNKIREIAEKSNIINNSVKDSTEILLKHLYTIEESGQTALGPAILYSIYLIKENAPGSKIILFTDGVANIGLGSLDGLSLDEADKVKIFYKDLALVAKEKGIIINLLCFEGEESKISFLQVLCEETGGEIIKVKPTEILDQFSNLLTQDIIASNVKVSMKIHKIMCFRNEIPEEIKDNGSTIIKNIGNVTSETEIFIEYSFKSSEEIALYKEFDFNTLKSVAFQAIIEYTSKTGDKCRRVISQIQELSSDKEKIEKEAKYDLISVNAIKKTSQLAKEGQYRNAQANALAWKKMIKRNEGDNKEVKQEYNNFKKNLNVLNDEMQEEQNNELNDFGNDFFENTDTVTQTKTRQIRKKDQFSKNIYELGNNNFNVEKSKKKK